MEHKEDLAEEIRAQIDSHFEWLFVSSAGRTFPLTQKEIEVSSELESNFFAILDDTGYSHSRIEDFCKEGDDLLFQLASAPGGERQSVRLIPRPSARELSESVLLARMVRANQIGAALLARSPELKLSRVSLNVENGRLAQILARDSSSHEIAVLSDVTSTMTHESVMTSAILWSEKLRRRKKPINDMWIAAERKQARPLQKLLALFNRNAVGRFHLLEILSDGGNLTLGDLSTQRSLWRTKSTKLSLPTDMQTSETAAAIMALAPNQSDIIFSKHGETIRFCGLPFARVRKVAGDETAWFGVEGHRTLLTQESWPALSEIALQLETHRAAKVDNKRHELYRAAPEAWLESILRRNIRQLDNNLILSPVYNQYRASADKIDLLAIRRDGRLVIIELKTSPDREMVFQAADYWRKVELQRRSGELARNRAFGDMEIRDEPALVYAVAPALSFHRDFGLFAGMLRRDLEIWRFDLHEDWRSEIKVLSRRRYEG